MSEPLPVEDVSYLHPLAAAMGSEWRWLADGMRGLVVLLHPTGLHVDMDESLLEPGAWLSRGEWTVIGAALNIAVKNGRTGHVVLETSHNSEGLVWVDVKNWPEPAP